MGEAKMQEILKAKKNLKQKVRCLQIAVVNKNCSRFLLAYLRILTFCSETG